MTVLGKILVFLTTLLALFGLSMAMWSFAEERDLTAKARAISEDIDTQRRQIFLEYQQLQTLLAQAARGDRPMPYDPGDPYGKEPAKTVSQTRAEVAQLEKGVADARQAWNNAQQELIAQILELKRLRDEVRAGLDEQKRLRETITPDRAVNPQALPLREVVRAAWSAMVDSDRRIAEARPTLVSEVMLLMSLQQRHLQLKQRAEQLKLKGADHRDTAAAAK